MDGTMFPTTNKPHFQSDMFSKGSLKCRGCLKFDVVNKNKVWKIWYPVTGYNLGKNFISTYLDDEEPELIQDLVNIPTTFYCNKDLEYLYISVNIFTSINKDNILII